MKEQKHIDRLYQEKFRDFEAMPRPAVWTSIADKLKEKEKKPVIAPLWSRLAGVAAILTFLLLVGEWIIPIPKNTVVANEELKKESSERITKANSASEVALPRSESLTAATPAPTTSSVPADAQREKTVGILASTAMIPMRILQPSELRMLSALELYEHDMLMLPQSDGGSPLDKISQIDDQEVAAAEPSGGFEISTHAAPIYYGNMGKGNFIDPRLNNNSSEGEITYSYGINIAYNLNEKLKIRSGISKVNMSHNTRGVSYQAIAGSSPITSVSLESGATMKDHSSGGTSGRTPVAGTPRNPAGFLRPGNLNQKMGFLEIPLELEYNLFARKFELNIIGGASTLFLEENEVSLNSETISAEGRANNLNNISFSTNIGIGLDYNLSEKFKLNFEPMLKYQLNTFESPAADTRPYYFGIYSGFSYKF